MHSCTRNFWRVGAVVNRLVNLPQSTYTEFCSKSTSQPPSVSPIEDGGRSAKEGRDYANAIYNLVQPLVPITMEAFMDFRVNAMQLTGPEIEAIANNKEIESPGERAVSGEVKALKLKIKNVITIQKCSLSQILPSYSPLLTRRTRISRSW